MNHAQFLELLRAIFDTREDEIVCSEFFELLPKYVDLVLATEPRGFDSAATRPAQVAHHIPRPECAEASSAARIERSCGKIRLSCTNAWQEAGEGQTASRSPQDVSEAS